MKAATTGAGRADPVDRVSWLIARPALVDAALAVAALIVAILTIHIDPEGGRRAEPAAATALAALGCAPLLVRRRYPIMVLLAVAIARVIMVNADQGGSALLAAVALALYTVARNGDRRLALTVSLATAVMMALLVSVGDRDEDFLQELVGEVAIGLTPIAVADAARSRNERLRAMIETEAEARVQAERLRIARDLHDVVAHGLSTIAVQSGVAAHLLETRPEQAKASIEIINATGKRSLEELRSMVGVLRSTDEAPLLPTPADPDDLSTILDGAARAGVHVDLTVRGRFPDGVADSVVVAVHRILQEALTNVARHASTDADVIVDHQDHQVTVAVRNPLLPAAGGGAGDVDPPPTTVATATGVGILGMTERAQSLGGSLTAGPDGRGAFVVTAVVPYGHRSAETIDQDVDR